MGNTSTTLLKDKKKTQKGLRVTVQRAGLDEAFTLEWKRQFMLAVPILKPGEWSQVERYDQMLVYVPFEADPEVFNLLPSAHNGTVAQGDIVDHDLVFTVSSPFTGFDVVAHVKREIANVEWRLHHLRWDGVLVVQKGVGFDQLGEVKLAVSVRPCLLRCSR
jgi:hypothetical protein